MLESCERPGSFAIHLAMRAVVETEDIALTSSGGDGAFSQASLRMASDGLHSRNQPLRGFLPPITGNQRPHHGAVAQFAGGWNDPGVSHPKRRTKPLWRRPQRVGNRVMAKAQLNSDLSGSEPEKIRSGFGVIARDVSPSDGLFHQFRAFAHVSPNQKKCRLRVIAVQQIEQFRSDAWIRPIVKGNRQLAR